MATVVVRVPGAADEDAVRAGDVQRAVLSIPSLLAVQHHASVTTARAIAVTSGTAVCHTKPPAVERAGTPPVTARPGQLWRPCAALLRRRNPGVAMT